MGVVMFLLIVISCAMPSIERRLRERLQRLREVQNLCLTCVNSLVMRNSRGRLLVSCRFGGTMRQMKFKVCECSGFRPEGQLAELVTIEGFVREQREVFAEVAISPDRE